MDITSKDLQVLNALLLIEACANKKCSCHLDYLKDANAKSTVSEMVKHHDRRFQEIYKILKAK